MPPQPQSEENFLAKNLRTLMWQQGFTQDLLAETLGVSQGTISNYLAGRIPKAAQLIGLANLFQVTERDLLFTDLESVPATAPQKAKSKQSTTTRSYLRLLIARFEALPSDEQERWAKVFLKMLDELD